MDIFEEVMNSNFTVFKNKEIFDLDYIPEIIQCRDSQLRSILMGIKPLITNNKSLNTILLGNTSTGKTTVLKHALRQIEEHTNLQTCYVNCNIHDTARKCYFQIYRVLFGYEARKGLSTEIIHEEIMNKLEEQSFVLAIDDINYLNKEDANEIINVLFRANEFYHLNLVIIITINDETFKFSLERNARSILLGHEILFKDYSTEEIFSILKYRCEKGLKKGIITDGQIMKISEYSSKVRSLRRGLLLIQVLGQVIESENRDKIEDTDIENYIYK